MKKDQIILVNMYNPDKWKKTREKEHEVYLAKPKLGTKILNMLTCQSECTDRNAQFIVSGILGEKQVVSMNTLNREYRTLDNKDIDSEYLRSKVIRNGLIDWTKIKKIDNGEKYWAFNIPSSIKNIPIKSNNGTMIANKTGVNHGNGDFLICNGNSMPDFSTVRVINGNLFPLIFDMRAFSGTVDMKKISEKYRSLAKPKSIIGNIDKDESNNGIKDFEIVGRIEKGRKTIGYTIKDKDGNISNISREATIYLAGGKKLRNVRYQFYKGKVLLRGIGVDLDKLPCKKVEE